MLDLESIKFIINNCNEVTILNLQRYPNDEDVLSEESINYLANNLSEKVEKLNLGYQTFVKDEHVMKLILRCKRLTELNLNGTSISLDSLTCIIENLKHSLVTLKLSNTKLTFEELLELRAMPKLRVLNCSHLFLPIEIFKVNCPRFCKYTNNEILTANFYAEGFEIALSHRSRMNL
jgi:hypothetical protein